MLIGVPKEIKNNENRVALTPAGVMQLKAYHHKILIQTNAGLGSGFSDEEYVNAGATVVKTAQEVWNVDLVVKVKEPLPSEFQYFRDNLILFTYLHLAPEFELTQALRDKNVTAIAYETVQLPNGVLPLLTPMSEVAGRMSVQIGANLLQETNGGKGILLGGVPGVKPAKVTVIGGGIAGTNAAKMAVGLGADVTILDVSINRLRELDDLFKTRATTLMSNSYNIADAVIDSDLLIGAVLIPGAKAPKLVSVDLVKKMNPGSVIVDIAIDQGGCIETMDRITTHGTPTYEKHGVVHYAVANMPGAVPHTSTAALTNATLPYIIELANKGCSQACLDNPDLLKGINVIKGEVTHQAVALAQGLTAFDAKNFL